METRQLGKSGLQVGEISFGAMTFGGRGHSTYERFGTIDGSIADRMVHRCLDAGVNLFDTANTYADGRSEEVLGQALGSRRSEAIIATKGFNRIGPGPNDIGASRHYITRAVEGSLRRLGTDYIDLYQIHNYDGMTPQEETVSVLDDLTRAGKIRYSGISNYSGWHLMKGLAIADRLGAKRFCSQQINYSLLSRDAENELVPLSLEENVGVLVWGPLQSGLLSGKYRRGRPLPEGTRLDSAGRVGFDREQIDNIVDILVNISEERNTTVSSVALNWLLKKRAVTSVIVGARNEDQLEENLCAAEWTMSDTEERRLDKASEQPWIYPYKMHQLFGGDRSPYYLRGEEFRPWREQQ